MRNNSVITDTTHGLSFSTLGNTIETAASETSAPPHSSRTGDTLTLPHMTAKTITLKWNTTSTLTPLERFTEKANVLITHSMSTISHRKVVVRVTNIVDSH